VSDQLCIRPPGYKADIIKQEAGRTPKSDWICRGREKPFAFVDKGARLFTGLFSPVPTH